MVDIASLGAIGAAFFVAAAAPGPATLALATVAMRAGRRSGLAFGAGLTIGLAVWGVVAATGLGALLQASTHALSVLKLVGGAYLLWLAFASARAAARGPDHPPAVGDAHRGEDRRGFRRGLWLNLSNPKAVLAWMAVLALGLGDGGNSTHIALATATCMALGALIYAGYAVVFSTPRAMAIYRRAQRGIEAAAAGLFALAGLGLIRSAFARS